MKLVVLIHTDNGTRESSETWYLSTKLNGVISQEDRNLSP
jgi:hypothetical protein